MKGARNNDTRPNLSTLEKTPSSVPGAGGPEFPDDLPWAARAQPTRRGFMRGAALAGAALAVAPLTACMKDEGTSGGTSPAGDGSGSISSDAADEQKNAVTQLNKVTYPETVASDDFEKLENIEAKNPLSTEFLGALDAFANNAATYAVGEFEFSPAQPNACISPVGLYLALALLAQGARGDTQTQLLDALGMKDADTLAEQCQHLINRLWAKGTPEGDARQSTLQIANSLWMRSNVAVEKDFLDKAGKHFYAECYEVDEVAPAGEAMGSWIANHTGATQKSQVDLATDWVASLIDAIWYKDSWTKPFNENDTFQDTFYASDGNMTCDFMTQELECGYAGSDEYQIVSLPLDTGAYLALLLPAEDTDANAFFARATGVGQLFRSANNDFARVTLTVPKVAFDVRAQLAEVCQRMGVTSAFESGADLSGLTSGTAHVSDVEQGTRFALNEMGVEAIAYTNLAVNVTSVMATDHEVVEVRFDRPFSFYLAGEDGVVLFCGMVGNPNPA